MCERLLTLPVMCNVAKIEIAQYYDLLFGIDIIIEKYFDILF
jgi:hypothetical protein